MNSIRFDTLARMLGRGGSRRQALRLLVSVSLGAGVAHTSEPSPAAAQDGDCREADERCRRDRQCCSQECLKKPGRRRGKCTSTSLGPLAGNCTQPPATCATAFDLPRCQVGTTNGTCYASLTGEVICADSLQCNTNASSPPVCDDDQDCVSFGANSRCVDTCQDSICTSKRACATYAGEG